MQGAVAKRWVVRGRVQGVGFRDFVQRRAMALGLSGWARNREDGTVEVYASGTEAQLRDLASALHQGPTLAEVRGVEEREDRAESGRSFLIR